MLLINLARNDISVCEKQKLISVCENYKHLWVTYVCLCMHLDFFDGENLSNKKRSAWATTEKKSAEWTRQTFQLMINVNWNQFQFYEIETSFRIASRPKKRRKEKMMQTLHHVKVGFFRNELVENSGRNLEINREFTTCVCVCARIYIWIGWVPDLLQIILLFFFHSDV